MAASQNPLPLTDWLYAFEAGVNAGIAPLLLPKNQLANGLNTNVRGTFIHPRPPFRKLTFDADSEAVLAAALALGPYQGGEYWQPDNDDEGMMIAVGGQIIQITPGETTATAINRPITSGDMTPIPPGTRQVWMCQAEKWMIINDGANNPLFVDNVDSRRSTYGNAPTIYTTTTATAFSIPALNGTGSVDFTDTTNLYVGAIVTVTETNGQFKVNTIAGNAVTFTNTSMIPPTVNVVAGTVVSWQSSPSSLAELPPGRQVEYGMGRVWEALADGKQFVASDIVGGSSGTAAENYRDSVLKITENTYLSGGGYFTVPGPLGSITFMRFTATLDASLGQGPLQVGTHKAVFSVNTPVDRTIWQVITNPILTESLIGNGGLGQWSTINVNGDIIFRSLNGIRSLILARREFSTWGNTPQSREIQPLIDKDNVSLLGFSSAIFFDNRMIMTATPVINEQGVYHIALAVMNCDPLSSLHGKSPSVYDALQWTGLNVLQLFQGEFSSVDRAFAVCVNLKTAIPKLELYEILRESTTEIRDNETEDIVWSFESPVLFGPQVNPRRDFLMLEDGEIYVDKVKGTVNFQVWYKPDQYPCWTPWHAWQVCASEETTSERPQFRPRMGLGSPSDDPCDEVNNRPMNRGYTFQVKLVISGYCRFLGARFRASKQPDPAYAPMVCDPICET